MLCFFFAIGLLVSPAVSFCAATPVILCCEALLKTRTYPQKMCRTAQTFFAAYSKPILSVACLFERLVLEYRARTGVCCFCLTTISSPVATILLACVPCVFLFVWLTANGSPLILSSLRVLVFFLFRFVLFVFSDGESLSSPSSSSCVPPFFFFFFLQSVVPTITVTSSNVLQTILQAYAQVSRRIKLLHYLA